MFKKRTAGQALAALVIAAVLSGLLFWLSFAQSQAATAVWAPPAILLPYVGDNPSLCVNPLDSTITYFAGSGGYGMAAGSEANNWLNATFTKLSDQKGSGDCAYDEFGTLHAVWSLRNEAGNYNIFYNSVQKGSGNVPLYRNLTRELYGQDKYTIKTDIAVSIPQRKVFITYQERRDGGDALMFIESANQGGTWSKPLQLGILSGYRPAEPDIIVDKAGLPHIFYGVFNEGGPSIINHRMRQADGSWTAPEKITGNNLSRPIWTQAELDAVSGDIYVSWLEGQAGISHWTAATGKWTFQQDITNAGGRAFLPTIAVNSQTGTVWMIWLDGNIIWTRQSLDHGVTWQPRELAVDLGAAKIGRMYGLKARSTRGIIYLLISGDQLDPLYYVGPTLFLMTFNQSINSQPGSPTPVITTTPGGTSTPVIAPTITPQPTATPQPTVTPQPTATPMSLLPSVAPTQVPAISSTVAPTTTPQVLPTTIPPVVITTMPPATPTPQPKPTTTQAQQQPAPAVVQTPIIVVLTPTPLPPTATAAPTPTPAPTATATLAAEIATVTAEALAQQQAAANPQSLIIPLAPPGSGGKGPELVLPTQTPLPTFTAGTTTTAVATNTAGPTATNTVTAATVPTAATNQSASAQASKPAEPIPTTPPPPGALWVLPLGLVLAGKGFLNLLGLLIR